MISHSQTASCAAKLSATYSASEVYNATISCFLLEPADWTSCSEDLVNTDHCVPFTAKPQNTARL